MPRKEKNTNPVFEILYLVGIVLFLRLWTKNPYFAAYNLQLTGLIVVCYFITKIFLAGKEDVYSRLLLDSLIITSLLLLIVSATGELNSPLFFLIYFYLFAGALLFEPLVTITITIALGLFFLKELNSVNTILQVSSIFLFSPLAIFFGKKYLKLLQAQEKIKILAKKSKQLTANGLQQTANIAASETNTLLWLSLDFKDSLLKIIHHTSDLMTDIGQLNFTQKEKLEKIHSTAKDILKSGEKLLEKIDRETD